MSKEGRRRGNTHLGEIYDILKNNEVFNNKRKLTGSKENLGGLFMNISVSLTIYQMVG